MKLLTVGQGMTLRRIVGENTRQRRAGLEQMVRIMKLTGFLLMVAFLHVSAASFSQQVTLSMKDAPIEKVFREIERQTGYGFLYNKKMLAELPKVTINVKNADIREVLDRCFSTVQIDYVISEQTILVREKDPTRLPNQSHVDTSVNAFTGTVVDETGEPLSGASIKLKEGKVVAITDAKGQFRLKDVNSDATIIISFTGYSEKTVVVDGKASFRVTMSLATNKLDEAQVIAYGATTERLSTGDISKVSSQEIAEQPVSNVLAAIEGRVPGLVITQTTGIPGGGFTAQIRGKNSLENGTDPFYVVDGVPYNSEILSPDGLLNASLQGGSPLNFINPYDIESVEVLKDADATAIYGSRAANGAILITTKRGANGAMKISLNLNSGLTTPARDITLLNTQQYLTMRNEAFMNDGETPQSYDYDVNGTWDTTRYTNWSKVLTRNKAEYTDVNLSFSGGNTNTQYLVSGGYNRQTTGFPTLISHEGSDQTGSVHFNINSSSQDKRFKISFTGSYVNNDNNVQNVDFSQERFSLAPDAPSLYNSDGSLNWAPLVPGQAGTFSNPLALLYETYSGLTTNIVGNSVVSYTLLHGLELRSSFGYTNTQMDEVQTNPTTTVDPGRHPTSGSSNFNTLNSHSWIIEPQVEYKLHFGKGLVDALAGTTFHEENASGTNTNATGFISDALLQDIQAASNLEEAGVSSQYKYQAVFGRLNYNWADKYALNLTGRRDGSSRFGPGRQFADFGAIGAAWIFTREDIIHKAIPFLSFGKLRGSYGLTGNDQIGDYQYISLYTPTFYPYQGSQGLSPANLFNPDLAWETTKKLEGSIELGFLKDRITIEASLYRNRSGDQLVHTPIAVVAGFASIPSNLPALVQNSGKEFVLNTINIKKRDFTWSSVFTLTMAANKLISFPGLASSPYKNDFVVGQPITILKEYKYTGVNDTTGLYEFASAKGGPTYNPDFNTDPLVLVNLTPKYYGGFQNNFSFKEFTLNVFFQFVNQQGEKLFAAYGTMPGVMANQPTYVLDRWQKPGDNKTYQQFSQDYSLNPANEFSYVTTSNFAYGNASFIRLKNLGISWQLPTSWKKQMHMDNCRFYVNAQNLLTFTPYQGIDPESQGTGTGPRRTWVAGFQLGL